MGLDLRLTEADILCNMIIYALDNKKYTFELTQRVSDRFTGLLIVEIQDHKFLFFEYQTTFDEHNGFKKYYRSYGYDKSKEEIIDLSSFVSPINSDLERCVKEEYKKYEKNENISLSEAARKIKREKTKIDLLTSKSINFLFKKISNI